jgi:xylan 1,4-beta-xylosidase
MLVNHALPRHSIEPVRARIQLAHAAKPKGAWVERIDANHANAKGQWQALGEPEYLDSRTVEQLHKASLLVRRKYAWKWRDKTVSLSVELPPHAVAALTVEFVA